MNPQKWRYFLLITIFSLFCSWSEVFAQRGLSRNDTARSSRGRDFYMVFLPNFHEEQSNSSNTRDSLFIFVTCDKTTSGQITYRNRLGNTVTRGFAITDPTQIFTLALNYGDIELEGFNITQNLNRSAQSEQIAQQYVRIEANDEVTVYALNQARFTSDAHLVLPVPALGNEYVVMSYYSDGSGLPFIGGVVGSDTPSQFAVVAVADDTEVVITPSVSTFPSQSSSTQTVRLQRGQSYLLQADTRLGNGRGDLTGSRIKATKPVAVFGGHQRALIPIQFKTSLSSRDHLVEQIPPVDTWGKSVFLVPHAQPSFQAAIGEDVFRVLAAYDDTRVAINGQQVAVLRAGEFYEAAMPQNAAWITSNEQILVAQFKKTGTPSGIQGGVGQQVGDPFMMVIPTVEQYDKSYRFINAQVRDNGAAGGFAFTEHYVTIVVPQAGVNSMIFDGQPIPAGSFRQIANSTFAFGNFRVSAGVHTARGDSAFGIYVYGYGQANSYGYIGGGRLRVIAPDRDPPQIVLQPQCFGVRGTVLDTLVTDSRIDRVTLTPATAANVRLSVDSFTRYADSVKFSAELVNIFTDGAFSVEARDSVGFISRRTIPLYGFTVGFATQNIVQMGSVQNATLQNNEVQRLTAQGPTGAAALLNLQAPTGRTRSIPFIITNYGTTTQTISGVRFASGLGVMRIVQTTLPIVLAPGASETLVISYRSITDGFFTDTLRIESTCASRAVAVLNLETRTDSVPPLSRTTPDACLQRYALDVTETGVFASGIATVVPERLVNCTFRLDSVGTFRLRALISVTNPRQDAFYTLQIRDSAGNTSVVGNTIPGFTVEFVGDRTTAGNFGETAISGTTNCVTLRYRNTGSTTFTFPTLAPRGNISFSMPVSQLPLVITPGLTSSISLCFAPTEMRPYRDTLIIGNNCLGDTLVLSGVGVPLDGTANSRCDVEVNFRTISTPRLLALAGTSPQPASELASLKIDVSEPSFITVSLFSANGIELGQVFEGEISSGGADVRIKTDHLQTGVYFCAVQAGLKRVMGRIVVVR